MADDTPTIDIVDWLQERAAYLDKHGFPNEASLMRQAAEEITRQRGELRCVTAERNRAQMACQKIGELLTAARGG